VINTVFFILLSLSTTIDPGCSSLSPVKNCPFAALFNLFALSQHNPACNFFVTKNTLGKAQCVFL